MQTHDSSVRGPSPLVDELQWLRALASRLAVNSDEADDLVQEAWLVAERSDQAHARSRRAWLGGVLRNRERMHRRGEARRRRREAKTEPLSVEPDPDLELHRQRVLSAVHEALDDLDEGDRQLLLARYCDEHTAPALAKRLGISASTVRSRLSRATARVRRSLDERWGGDRGAWAPAVAALPIPQCSPGFESIGWRSLLMAVGNKIVLGLVAMLIATGVWFGVVDRQSATEENDEATEPSKSERDAELAARKRAQRAKSPPDLTRGSLGGEVLAADTGEPLAGALVRLVLSPGSLASVAGPAPRVLTDAQGRFSVPELVPGGYHLSVAAPGYLPAVQHRVTLDAGAEAHDTVLRLHPGGNIVEGLVTDIGGGVVEGALVRVTGRSDRGPGGAAALTDADGHYRLGVPDGDWEIIAGGEDYTRQSRSVHVNHGPGRADFALVPGSTIVGRVVSRASGQPVVRAMVGYRVQQRHGKSRSSQSADEDQVMWTDDEGRFSLHPLEPGEYSLYASASGLASAANREVLVSIGEEISDVELRLDPAFDASGFVVDAADPERGLGGVKISTMDPGTDRKLYATTEADGYFRLLGVTKGRYPLLFDGVGFIPSGFEHSLHIEEGSRDDLIFELACGTGVRGRVEPPMKGRIKVKGRKEQGGFEIMLQAKKVANAHAEIAADGTFAIDSVPAGDWKLVATGDDGSVGELEVEVGDAELEEQLVPVLRRSTVRGQVLDAEGGPVVGVTVELQVGPDPSRPPSILNRTETKASGVSGIDGTFAVWGVDPGSYSLAVHDAANQPLEIRADGGEISVEAVGGRDIADLALRVTLPLGRIEGLAQGPEGEPLADAWVMAYANEDEDVLRWSRGIRPSTTLTDADGRFVFEGLADRSYDVHVRGRDANTRGVLEEVSVGDDVIVPLELLGEIRGVVTQGGQPVTQFSLELAARKSTTRADDGSFVLPRVEPGVHTVVVLTGSGSAHATADVAPGATVELTLELGDWGSVEGVLVSAVDGKPLADISLLATSNGGMRKQEGHFMGAIMGGLETDDEGHFSVEGLGSGRGKIEFTMGRIMMGGESLGSRGFEIQPGQHVELGTVVVLPPAEVAEPERGTLGLRAKLSPTSPSGPDAGAGENTDDGEEPKLWIEWVDPQGPAAKAGVQAGDRVVAIDGITEAKVGTSTLSAGLRDRRIRVGQSYALHVERDGGPQTITIEAGAQTRP